MTVQPQLVPVSDRRNRYARDGYVIADGLFPSSAISGLRADMARVFSHQLRAHSLPIHDFSSHGGWRANLVSLFGVNTEAFQAAAHQCQLLPSLQALSTSPPIQKLLRELGLSEPVLATPPSCYFRSRDLSAPGGPQKAPPHQDWRSTQGSLDACTVWLPLTKIDEKSYPLEVVAGSHRYGLLKSTPHDVASAVNDPRIREDDYTAVLVEPGDAVIFSGFLVHRTSAQGDERIRLALSLRYNNLAEPSFIERGYPSTYKFSAKLDLMVEGFPSEAQVAAFFQGGE